MVPVLFGGSDREYSASLEVAAPTLGGLARLKLIVILLMPGWGDDMRWLTGFLSFVVRVVTDAAFITALILDLILYLVDYFTGIRLNVSRGMYEAIFGFGILVAAYRSERNVRNAAREAALLEGQLRINIDDRNTCTYPFRDRRGRFVMIYGTIHCSVSAARITALRLSDRDGRHYNAIAPPQVIETLGNTSIRIGQSPAHFIPSAIFMLIPNQPKETVMLFQAHHEEWRGPISTVSYTLAIQDDLGRSTRADFSCRVHLGETL